MPEPGLLPLGILPGADGDRLGRRSPGSAGRGDTPPPRGCPRCRGPGRRRVPFAQHRRHFLDQPAADHLLGPHLDPLVQHRPRRGEPHVPGRRCVPSPRARLCHSSSGCPVSSAISMAREARCRPPPAKPGSSRAAQRTSSGGDSRATQCSSVAAPLRIERRLDEQPFGQRPDVETGAAHHDRQLVPRRAPQRSTAPPPARIARRCSARPARRHPRRGAGTRCRSRALGLAVPMSSRR